MVSNPHKEERRCVIHLKEFIKNMNEGEGIRKELLIWGVKAEYAVSKRFIIDFLNDYITIGAIREAEGVLYANK